MVLSDSSRSNSQQLPEPLAETPIEAQQSLWQSAPSVSSSPSITSQTTMALHGEGHERADGLTVDNPHQTLQAMPSGMTAGMDTPYSTLPLDGVSSLLRLQTASSELSPSRYYISEERLCESYRDGASPHITYDLNMPVENAFLEPRSIIPRTPIDWEARYPMTPEAGYQLPRQWCRIVAFYTDWTSHLSELQMLDLDDRVCMLSARMNQCAWLWVASRSITLAGGQMMVFSDGGCYPLDPVDQWRVNPEINDLFQPLCTQLNSEIIQPALDICVREEELALLKVLCLCVPVPGLKPSSLEIVQSAQAKYQAALVDEVMRHPVGNGTLDSIGRLTKMMSWLSTVERLTVEDNKQPSLLTLFNIADMKDSLPYELHVDSD